MREFLVNKLTAGFSLPRRILQSPPPIPKYLSRPCQELLAALMYKEPSQRLGAGGAQEVKDHPWFQVRFSFNCCTHLYNERSHFAVPQDISWADVLARHLPAPFKPYISDELDVGNFSDEFTAQDPVDSPAQPPTKHADIFRVRVPPSHHCVFSITLHSSPSPYSSPLSLPSFLSPRATLSLLLQFCSLTMYLPSPMEEQMVSHTHSR